MDINNRNQSSFCRRVRILEGEHRGLTVWIDDNLLTTSPIRFALKKESSAEDRIRERLGLLRQPTTDADTQAAREQDVRESREAARSLTA